MERTTSNHSRGPIVATALVVAIAGAILLSTATHVAWAQTEPSTAANGVLLPPVDFDPVAARNADPAVSAVAPASATAPVPTTDESAPSGTPEAAAGDPIAGNSTTTSLGGSDVAVSSVGGSYEVDRPSNRSERRR